MFSSLYQEEEDDYKSLETLNNAQGNDFNLCNSLTVFTALFLVTSITGFPLQPSIFCLWLEMVFKIVAWAIRRITVFLGVSQVHRTYKFYSFFVCFPPNNVLLSQWGLSQEPEKIEGKLCFLLTWSNAYFNIISEVPENLHDWTYDAVGIKI